MDKKLLILLLLPLLAGCLNDMPYTPEDTEPQLVMNALLTVGEDSHEVWLGLSKPGCVDTLTGVASVHCHINGSVGVNAIEAPGQQRLRRFVFSAPFSPGDEILLEAFAGRRKARATVTVPQVPVLKSIDTLTVGDSASRQLAFRIGISDSTPGADYYSLGIFSVAQLELFYKDTPVGTVQSRSRCSMDTGDDLILSEEGIAAANMDSIFEFGTPNYYGAFFDSQFDCSSAVLKPKVSTRDMDWWLFGEAPVFDSIYVHPSLRVELSHISVRHYYYLKALNSIKGGSSDLVLEEVAVPDNVEGGLGFVGISNTVASDLDLAPYGYSTYYYEDGGAED